MVDLRIGDCLDPVAGMASLPDRSIDVVITDPPYSEHVHSKQRRGLTRTHYAGATDEINARDELGFDSMTVEIMEACADQFERLAKRWVLVFCDMESAHLWIGAMRSAGLEYLRTCAWHKIGGAPQFTGDRPAVWGEAIVCCHRPSPQPSCVTRLCGDGFALLTAALTEAGRFAAGLAVQVAS